MKQFTPVAKLPLFLIAIVALSLFTVGCLTKSTNANSRRADAKSSPAPVHVNINTASAKEIEQLPGIGPVIAERIVSYREQHGPFKRREDLIMVEGISGKKYEEIRSMIVVE